MRVRLHPVPVKIVVRVVMFVMHVAVGMRRLLMIMLVRVVLGEM